MREDLRLPFAVVVLVGQAAACLDFDALTEGARPTLDASSVDGGTEGITGGPPDGGATDAPSTADLAFLGSAQAGPVSADATLELALPPSTATGDVVLLALHSNRDLPTPVFPSDGGAAGWTTRFRLSSRCNANGLTTGFTVLSRLVAADDERTVRVRFDATSTTTDSSSGIASVWRGADPHAPIDVEVAVTPANLTAPSLTTTVPDGALFAVFASQNGPGQTWTPPPGMTARASTGVLATFSEALGAAGATGPRTAQMTGDECGIAIAMFALRPAR